MIASPISHSGTSRSCCSPLIIQVFPILFMAKAWCPRGGLRVPLDAIGFDGKLFLSDLLVYPILFHDYRETLSASRTALIASWTSHSGTSRGCCSPLFSQGFSILFMAKLWCPCGGLRVPFDAIGCIGKLFLSELLNFPIFFHDFRETLSGSRTPLRGVPVRPVQSHRFYKAFEDSGRLCHRACLTLAI